VARVDFYAGATLIGSDGSSPYSVTWNAPAGSYSLTAVAFDNTGAKTTSAARSISVSINQAPSVALTSPVAGTDVLAPATITVSATASDTDGGIVSVAFYAGSTLLGTDSSSPITMAWQNAPAGSYSITAVATDTTGAQTTSAARTITVTTTRTVRFVPSTDATLVASYLLEVFAAGADPATATPAIRQDLGKPTVVSGESQVDITSTLKGLSAGTYFTTVSAVGTSGTASRSNASPTFSR
jgi:hypothetical protein